jgi:hypothetical protein
MRDISLPWDMDEIPDKVPLGDFVRTVVIRWLNEFMIHFGESLNDIGTVTESSEWNIEDLFKILEEDEGENE